MQVMQRKIGMHCLIFYILNIYIFENGVLSTQKALSVQVCKGAVLGG